MADTPTTPTTETPAAPTGAALLYAQSPTPAEAAPAPSLEPPAEGTVSGEAPSTQPPTDAVEGAEAGKTLATGEEPPAPAPEGAASPAPEPAPLTLASYEVALPEGFVPDDGLMTKFKETALAAKLDPKSAQGFVDLYASALQSAAAAATSSAEAQSAAWRNETLALPEFTGATRDASTATLGRFMDDYGSPELRSVLDATGLGNNPHLVRALFKVASMLDEGKPASPGLPANPGPNNGKPQGQRSPGQILYASDGPGSIPTQQ